MHTEETNEKGGKAKFANFGFAQAGHGIFEMMSKCCVRQDGFPDCSTMMKNMMDTMKNHSLCTPNKEAAEFEGRKK